MAAHAARTREFDAVTAERDALLAMLMSMRASGRWEVADPPVLDSVMATAGGASTAPFKLFDGDNVTGLTAAAPVEERAKLYASSASGAAGSSTSLRSSTCAAAQYFSMP